MATAIVHCMAMRSGRILVTGYESVEGGVYDKYTVTADNWHEVVKLVAIVAPQLVKVSDVMIDDVPELRDLYGSQTLQRSDYTA